MLTKHSRQKNHSVCVYLYCDMNDTGESACMEDTEGMKDIEDMN